MAIEYRDICTKKTYTQNGEEKTVWLKCGTLKLNEDGKQFIELNTFPSTTFYVFHRQKKEEAGEEL